MVLSLPKMWKKTDVLEIIRTVLYDKSHFVVDACIPHFLDLKDPEIIVQCDKRVTHSDTTSLALEEEPKLQEGSAPNFQLNISLTCLSTLRDSEIMVLGTQFLCIQFWNSYNLCCCTLWRRNN